MYVECQKCGYEWDTSSEMKMVTCPSCSRKTPREEKMDLSPGRTVEPRSNTLITPGKFTVLLLIGALVLAAGSMVLEGPAVEQGEDTGEATMTSMNIAPEVNVLKNGESVGEDISVDGSVDE